VQVGQASPWVAAAIGSTWLWPRAGSVLTVLAGSLKLYPLLAVRWLPALALVLILAIVTAGLWPDWISAWLNAKAGCPPWSLPSLTCVTGSSVPGYLLAAILLVGAWKAPRHIGFFLMTVAMIVPAPDLYSGYLLVPFMGSVVMAANWKILSLLS
jgi:hypothetical protein